jgi:hypothetical protein
MAVIAKTSIQPAGAVTVTRTTLGSSDTLVYDSTKDPILILDNTSGGALTPNIDGDGGTTVNTPNLGNVSVSSGITLASIANGACVAIRLNTIPGYLQGTVTITGGSGIKASILEM